MVLLEQDFSLEDGDRKVKDLLKEKMTSLGTKIEVETFARFECGEGIEKQEVDFATQIQEAVENS